jgi:hypothetical protein
LEDLARGARREEEARLRRLREFNLKELFLNLRSRDRLDKTKVRRSLPARSDRELVDLVRSLLREAGAFYLDLRQQWQREAVGCLTTLGAEALARLGEGPLSVPDGLDYVGINAAGEPRRPLRIKGGRLGNFVGMHARHLELEADRVGDYCFRRAGHCVVKVKKAGKCLAEEAENVVLDAEEVGDWMMLKARNCRVNAYRVGRLAGLDSQGLVLRVHYAGNELGARARDAEIYVYREVKSLGLRGSGVIYLRHPSAPWRTSFRLEKLP